MLVDTQKLVDSWAKCDFYLISSKKCVQNMFMTNRDLQFGFLKFDTITNDFDQRTSCGAPVRWSKYTTGSQVSVSSKTTPKNILLNFRLNEVL